METVNRQADESGGGASVEPQVHQAPSKGVLVVRTLLVAVAYMAAAQLSLLLKHPLGGISPLWLPSAVALVAAMLFGRGAVAGVVAGGITSSLASGFSPGSAVTGAVAATVEVLLAHAILQRRRVTLDNLLDGVRPMWRFVLAALPAAMVGAVLGVAGLLLTGAITGSPLQGLALWFAGDFVGMLLLVPLATAVRRRRAWQEGRRRAWLPIVLTIAATLVIFFFTDPSRLGHHVFGYLVFPFVVWTALVASARATTMTHAAAGGLAVIGTALGLGPYAVTASPTDVALLQTFVVALVGTSLFLEAAMQDRRRVFDHLRQQANHDMVTGLLNRRGMQSALEQRMVDAREGKREVGVLFVDLDEFSSVNDTVGHEGGDQVLAEVASRLRGVLRPGDELARPGGDEFVILADGDLVSLKAAAQRVAEVVRQPVLAGGRPFRLTCSVGIARFPEDATDAASLMRFADIAMYRAKATGKNNCTAFTVEIHERRMERVELEAALRAAVARGDFRLHYQPQIDLSTGHIVGAEALLRWEDEKLGNVPPGVFVPVAEDIGLVNELGQWVIDHACAQLRGWIDAGFEPTRLAINLSPMQLGPELAASWQRAMDAAKLPADLLEAELTETCVMRDPATSLGVLQDLVRRGVRVSLDDFGTGQSSLSMLTTLPLDTVKIDRSFVQQVGRTDGAQVVGAVVSLVHRLGMRCLAEGVESESQEAFLRAAGCDAYQGFLYSRPLPPQEFEQRFLKRVAGAKTVLH